VGSTTKLPGKARQFGRRRDKPEKRRPSPEIGEWGTRPVKQREVGKGWCYAFKNHQSTVNKIVSISEKMRKAKRNHRVAERVTYAFGSQNDGQKRGGRGARHKRKTNLKGSHADQKRVHLKSNRVSPIPSQEKKSSSEKQREREKYHIKWAKHGSGVKFRRQHLTNDYKGGNKEQITPTKGEGEKRVTNGGNRMMEGRKMKIPKGGTAK